MNVEAATIISDAIKILGLCLLISSFVIGILLHNNK